MKRIKNLFVYLITAFSFLTIIPVPIFKRIKLNEKTINNSVAFYPIVGLFFGVVSYLITLILIKIKTDPLLVSFAVIISPYLLNKFLHFDGLCDVADSFLANKTQKERLIILKDSRIGSFALGSGVFFILLKFIIIKIIIGYIFLIPLLILFPVYSRFGIIFLSKISKYPRKKGTAFFIVGKISNNVFIISILILIIISFLFLLFFGFVFIVYLMFLIFILFFFIVIFSKYSLKKINGVTGDVLGAAIELLELILPAAALIIFKTMI
jgi:adenosylcobinamide-GDP ribazoletransferase